MKKKNGVLTGVTEKDLKLLYKNPKKFWKNVVTIGGSAFNGLENLTEITIPGTVNTIETRAFFNNYQLKQIVMENGVHEIKSKAFVNNENIEKIRFPGSVQTINSGTFRSLFKVKHMEIGEGVKEIKEVALKFQYSDMIILPRSLEKINVGNIFTKGHYYVSRISENSSKYPGCTIVSKEPLSKEFNVEWTINTKEILALRDERKYFNQILESIINDKKLNIEYPEEMNKLNEYLLKNKIELPMEFVQKLNDEGKISDFIENTRFKAFRRIQEYSNDDMSSEVFTFAYNIGCFSADPQLSNAANTWLESIVKPDRNGNTKMSFYDIEEIALHLPLKGPNKEFSEFLFGKNDKTNKANFDEIMQQQNRGIFLTSIYKEYLLTEDQLDEKKKNRRTRDENGKLKIKLQVDTINEKGVKAKKYREFKPTVELFKEYFKKVNLSHGGSEREKRLAEELAKFNLTKEQFDEAMEIYNEFDALNIPLNISGEHLKEITDYRLKTDKLAEEAIKDAKEIINNLTDIIEEEFTYEWLEKNDPKNFVLGLYCDCCAHLNGAGHGIVKSNFVHPDIQNLVINDKDGNPIAKSTAYINRKEGYIVFNNVEVADRVLQFKDQIYEKYNQGVKAFVEKYNSLNPSNPIKKVNVGMKNNDLEEQIRSGNKPSRILAAIQFGKYSPADKGDYMGDWNEEQYTIYENKKR